MMVLIVNIWKKEYILKNCYLYILLESGIFNQIKKTSKMGKLKI